MAGTPNGAPAGGQTTQDIGAQLTLAAASANVNGPDIANTSHRGVKVVVDVTAITGTTPTLVVTIEGKDNASGKYYLLLASASLTATGTTVYTVYPGAPVSGNVSANDVLPKTFRVRATIGGTTPAVTATVGVTMLP